MILVSESTPSSTEGLQGLRGFDGSSEKHLPSLKAEHICVKPLKQSCPVDFGSHIVSQVNGTGSLHGVVPFQQGVPGTPVPG